MYMHYIQQFLSKNSPQHVVIMATPEEKLMVVEIVSSFLEQKRKQIQKILQM